MKRKAVWILCVSLLVPEVFAYAQPLPKGEMVHEEFMYEIRYGWIKIGEATLSHQMEGPTLTVDVLAYTTGIVNWIARLKDSIHTEINAKTLKPVESHMDRREGKYRRKQEDFFDFDQDSVAISVFESRGGKEEEMESMKYFLRDSTFDMLSSYVYLRSQPWGNFNPGDSVMLNMFYEDEYYPFGIEYIGEEGISTEFGERTCHMAYILFPISGTFPEKHMVKVWVSADDNRLPLRIEAKMKFGKAVCELVEIN